MATTRTSSAGKVSFGSWESEEREHPQGCSFFCALSIARRFCSPKGLLLSLHRAGGESKGPFSFAKENGPFGTPRERLRLAVSGLDDFYASGMKMPARGVAALALLYDLSCFYYPLPLCLYERKIHHFTIFSLTVSQASALTTPCSFSSASTEASASCGSHQTSGA